MDLIQFDTTPRVYNSPLELGMRTLVILEHLVVPVDLEFLMYLDYLALNTSDVGGPESLHAPIPNRGVQVYARRELIRKGLVILISKDLIKVSVTAKGVLYEINETGRAFLGFFSSQYYYGLVQCIRWVTERYGSFTTNELETFVDRNLEKWSGEFITPNETYL